MSVRSLTADVSLLLGCSAAVSTCDVLFLLCLSLDLRLFFLRATLSAALESYASQDYSIDIIASELSYLRVLFSGGKVLHL